MLDALDIKIVNLLTGNSRMSWTELALKIGLSVPSTADRVRRLEEKEIIRNYTLQVNEHTFGYSILAFVAVQLSHPKHRKAFLNFVEKAHEVQECHHVTEEDDYLLKVRCKNPSHLDVFLSDGLKSVAGVLKTRTTIALGTAKELSAILIPEGED